MSKTKSKRIKLGSEAPRDLQSLRDAAAAPVASRGAKIEGGPGLTTAAPAAAAPSVASAVPGARRSGFVAIVGRPNAGKSTLLNSLLGTELSIVTPKAQTTRERVLGILTEREGQIVFVDTPGIHRAKDGGINACMVGEAREAMDGPSLVWYLIDPRSELKHELVVLELIEQATRRARTPVLFLLNKNDLIRTPEAEATVQALESAVLEEARARGIAVAGWRRISAGKGRGTDTLLQETWSFMPEGPLYYPDEEQLSDRPTRFFVAEKIREQLLMHLGEELPYSCAVEIESFREGPDMPRIEATIHVERDSQKGMVVGKGGLKIKTIGQHARHQIEKFLGSRVFLGLRVKVLKEWTRDAEALRRMGYHLPDTGKKRRANG